MRHPSLAPRAALAFALLVLCGPTARAGEGPRPKVLGWTADGVYLASIETPSDFGAGDEGGSGSVTYADVRDGRTGLISEFFVVSLQAFGDPKEMSEADRKEYEEYKASPDKAAFSAWKKGHPTRCLAGRASPDGKTRAEIKLKGSHVSGKWGKSTYQFADDDEAGPGNSVTLSLSLVRDGKSVPAATWKGDSGAGTLSGDVSLCWAPDGRRVAWFVHRNPSMMRDLGETALFLSPTGGPRIQLVADKGALPRAAALVGAALDQGGFTPTASKESSEATPREKTVVYAAAGFETAAAAVAALVPGGATVAKLDWKPPFDLVVGIGKSALPGNR